MDEKSYLKAIGPAMDMVVKKHEDYNSGVQLTDYFPFGDTSYIQMLHVKVLRLRSLHAKTGAPNFESCHDTVMDLINYAVFYAEYLQRKHINK
jgi:hypothetical protein